MDGYLGEIKMFAGTFAPVNWQFCWGQSLKINEYDSLYALIGTQFGGDGVTTFNLPDLRGRVPIGGGAGPGLTPRTPGQYSGAENVTLTTGQMPQHSHTVKCDVSAAPPQHVNTPVNNIPGPISTGTGYVTGTAGTANMRPEMLSTAGSNQPHENMSPWGCLQYIICVEGMWPPRD